MKYLKKFEKGTFHKSNIRPKIGDYIVKDTVVERKTVQDFISSMINHRLINQIEELKQYENKLLIIEGISEQELYKEDSEGVSANAIRGFLLSILRYFSDMFQLWTSIL